MKIIATITAYNEDLFLDQVLNTVYYYADEIIITDTAMQNVVDMGYPPSSNDTTMEIIEKWKKRGDKIHLIQPKVKPKNYTELSIPSLELAKQMKGNWLWFVGADEVWSEQCVKPMRNILSNYEKNGIFGINIYMHYFAPDMWHYKPFYNPRVARLTDDICLPFSTGDVCAWKEKGIWQSIELDKVPEKVRKINADYPSFLKVHHYSCVGYKRVKFKNDFYNTYSQNQGSDPFKHYMNGNWDYFKQQGYKEFTGQHPEIMKKHPLYSERLY